MPIRWYAVPQVTTTDDIDGFEKTYPKYSDTPGITDWSAIDLDSANINGLPWGGRREFAVFEVADGDEAILDDIEANNDATTMAEAGVTEEEVADWLNQKTGVDRTFAEWQTFLTNGKY